MSKIDLINYPFGHSSPHQRSEFAPGILKTLLADDLSPSIYAWKDVALGNLGNSAKAHGVNNYESVKTAVEYLGMKVAQSQMMGRKSLAIGGDHSQGFATVKGTLLAEVTKAILKGDIELNSQDPWRIKSNLAFYVANGNVANIRTMMDELINDGIITKEAIKAVTDNVVVVWVDSHGDFNTQDISPSGNFHGMSLAAACGLDTGGIEKVMGDYLAVNPKNVYVVCARDLDDKEQALMKQQGVKFEPFLMSDPYRMEGKWIAGGPRIQSAYDDSKKLKTLPQVIEGIFELNPDKKFIMSIDVDHIHGSKVPATGTCMGAKPEMREAGETILMEGDDMRLNIHGQSPAGPTLEHSLEAFRNLAARDQVIAMDLTEASTAVGPMGKPANGGYTTMRTTMKLLGSMLGMEIDPDKYDVRLKQLLNGAKQTEIEAAVAGRY